MPRWRAIGKKAFGAGTLPDLRRKLRGDSSASSGRAATSRPRRARRSRARRRRSRASSVGCRARRAWSSASRSSRRRTRRSRTTASRTIDGTRPASTSSTRTSPRRAPRYELEALTWHESVPGHHLQIAIAQELTGAARVPQARRLDRVRRGLGRSTPSGSPTRWASTRATLDRLGKLSFDAWRASRLVVDTGIHALGWTRRRRCVHARAHRARRDEQHRQRGRSLHRLARSGARVQGRPARDPAAARRGRGAPGAEVRPQGVPRRRCSAPAR